MSADDIFDESESEVEVEADAPDVDIDPENDLEEIDLEACSYRELQALAKEHGIRANQSAEVLSEELRQKVDDSEDAEAEDQDDEMAEAMPDLSALKERRTWEFDIEAPNGAVITFRGSEPEDDDRSESRGQDDQTLSADDKIAKLIIPTTKGELLHWRAMDYLNDEPEIEYSDWKDFSPKTRAIIAGTHLDHFGIEDFRSDANMDQLMELIDAGDEAELQKIQQEA